MVSGLKKATMMPTYARRPVQLMQWRAKHTLGKTQKKLVCVLEVATCVRRPDTGQLVAFSVNRRSKGAYDDDRLEQRPSLRSYETGQPTNPSRGVWNLGG